MTMLIPLFRQRKGQWVRNIQPLAVFVSNTPWIGSDPSKKGRRVYKLHWIATKQHTSEAIFTLQFRMRKSTVYHFHQLTQLNWSIVETKMKENETLGHLFSRDSHLTVWNSSSITGRSGCYATVTVSQWLFHSFATDLLCLHAHRSNVEKSHDLPGNVWSKRKCFGHGTLLSENGTFVLHVLNEHRRAGATCISSIEFVWKKCSSLSSCWRFRPAVANFLFQY